jgi:hypothetical protein
MTTVTPITGAYRVTVIPRNGAVRVYQVGKDKSCTCGRTSDHRPCVHVRAVKAYLENGGERAPEGTPPPFLESRLVPRTTRGPEVCPICGAKATSDWAVQNRFTGEITPVWACPADASHYYQWRRQWRAENGWPEEVEQRYRETMQNLVAMYRLSGASDEKIAAFLGIDIETEDPVILQIPAPRTALAA